MPTNILTIVLLSAALLGVPATSAAGQPDETLLPTAGPSGLLWQPTSSFRTASLVVAGRTGVVHRQRFTAGEPLAYRLTDSSGEPLADGTYSYELRLELARSEEVDRALRQAIAADDRDRLALLEREAGPLSVASSGWFVVQGGLLLEPERPAARPQREPVALADRDLSTGDDLITERLCVGFDCVDGEPFGDDLLKVKGLEVGVLFEDTSSAPQPTTDWRLTVNDGGEAFALSDVDAGSDPLVVEAGAPDDSLHIAANGRVGLGTAAPAAELEIAGSAPEFRLHDDLGPTDAGFELSGGVLAVEGDAGQNVAGIAADAPADSLVVTGDGDLGLASNAPTDRLHVLLTTRNGGLKIESTVANDLPQFTLIHPLRTWRARVNGGGTFVFTDATGGSAPFQVFAGADNGLFRIGISASNRVTIDGELYVGSTPVPDYVFEPDYALPALDEQLAYMAEHRHLPAVGAGEVDGEGRHRVNVAERQNGILEELEKAYLYIGQLHRTVERLEARLLALESGEEETAPGSQR